MKVKDVMSPGIEYVAENDSAATAAQKMRQADVGSLPVKDGQDRLSGIVTDRDIVIRAVAEGKDPGTTKVGEVMTAGAVTCPAEQTVEQAAKLMEEKQIRRLIVVDDRNQAVGIVAVADIAVKVPGKELAGEAVEEISKPAQPAT